MLQVESVSLALIEAAADRIQPYILPTPLLPGDALGYDGLWLKAESLQRTGSFKIRGAFNALIQLRSQDRLRGVITLSAGNHGQALAYAAQRFGIPCVVVVRDDAPRIKLDAIRRYGAELVLVPVDVWQRRLEEEQARRGSYLVHPFDDPAVINGQGTVGLEILQALPEVRTVVVPVGGGGLISGVAAAIKGRRPEVRVIGIEPEGACVVTQSLAAGRPVPLERIDTVADGLAPPYTRPLNLALVKELVDEVRTVSDAAIIDALRAIAVKSRLIVEPAGAAAVAGLAGLDLKPPAVAILTGGNVDQHQLGRWLSVQ
ncbi:MAG TPA: threonine/serine dehydratase [Candidatus Dormibacteraeota bacterium]|nr:threonine/serine dehydratase [Candidatus Dormibacteraeota bacterium]